MIESNITGAAKKAGVTRQVNQACIETVSSFCKKVGMDDSDLDKWGLFWEKNTNAGTTRMGKRWDAQYNVEFTPSGDECKDLDKIVKKINDIIKPVDALYTDYASWLENYWGAAPAVRDDMHKQTFKHIITGSQQFDGDGAHVVGYSISDLHVSGGEIKRVGLFVYIIHDDVE